MIFDILTLFPEMFTSYVNTSILGRAIHRGVLQVRCYAIRDFAGGKHRTTDDVPYGGGRGMVMKPEPLVQGIRYVRSRGPEAPVVLLSPQGEPFVQETARELAQHARLILVCGRYEGVDERVRVLAVDREISVGDFVMTGGELAAMVVVDATARFVPGVLGDEQSSEEETFSTGLLEYPQYTRPREYMDQRVPDVLLSGDHKRIADWRRRQSVERTLARRPDLIDGAALSQEEQALLKKQRPKT